MKDFFKNAFWITMIIITTLIFLVDLFFPIIISFYTDNFLLLFLYAVWWIPIFLGFFIFSIVFKIIIELWD